MSIGFGRINQDELCPTHPGQHKKGKQVTSLEVENTITFELYS